MCQFQEDKSDNDGAHYVLSAGDLSKNLATTESGSM